MISVGIVGGTGYTGVELLRLLSAHPNVSIRCVSSRSEAGVRVDAMFPNLRGHLNLEFSEPDAADLAACDVVFFATPHNVAMREVPALLASGTRVIDLSADFRLRNAGVWENWYGESHACPELLDQAIYGLPERNRIALKSARLVACAGCYPTAVQLGFMPLLEQGLVQFNGLIANVASGVSGAGRQAKVSNLLSESSDSMKAYGVAGHRHLPEIEQGMSDDAGVTVPLTFVPHLAPMIRGIHATLYGTLTEQGKATDLQQVYEQRFAAEPFVDVMPAGQMPETRSVRGGNVCRLAVTVPQARDTVVVTAVEDNLVKGASGQAVQCMNIMFGFNESDGLNLVPLSP